MTARELRAFQQLGSRRTEYRNGTPLIAQSNCTSAPSGCCSRPLELHAERDGLDVVRAPAALGDEAARAAGDPILGDAPAQLGAFGEVVVADAHRQPVGELDLEDVDVDRLGLGRRERRERDGRRLVDEHGRETGRAPGDRGHRRLRELGRFGREVRRLAPAAPGCEPREQQEEEQEHQHSDADEHEDPRVRASSWALRASVDPGVVGAADDPDASAFHWPVLSLTKLSLRPSQSSPGFGARKVVAVPISIGVSAAPTLRDQRPTARGPWRGSGSGAAGSG